MALVEHLELQRRRLGELQRIEPRAPLERLVGEAVAADHRATSFGVARIACRPATTRSWYDRNATSCASATTAASPSPAWRSASIAARSPSRGSLVSAVAKSSIAGSADEGGASRPRADARGDAQPVFAREAVDGLPQERVVARLRRLDDLGAEAPGRVQRVAGREAGGAVDDVGVGVVRRGHGDGAGAWMRHVGTMPPGPCAGIENPGLVTAPSDIPARLDALPWSRWHWRVVLALGTAWVLDGLEVTIVGSLGSVLERPDTLGLGAVQVGWAGSLYVAGAVLGALVFGRLADRLGRKRLFLVTLVVYMGATVATGLSNGFVTFACFRFLTGFGIG